MFEWGLIGRPVQKDHYEKLSKFITEKLGIQNQLTIVECEDQKFIDELKALHAKVSSVRVDFPFARNLYAAFEEYPAELLYLKSADCTIKDKGHFWLRSLLVEALRRLVVQSHLKYDYAGKGIVVGSGAAARASILALVQLGLKFINVVNPDKPTFEELERDFRRHCFTVELHYISQDDIKLLSHENTILVNATPLIEENILLTDLYYFNYLLPGGIVVDLNYNSADSRLMKEAQSQGMNTFTGLDVLAHKDLYWMELALGCGAAVAEYREAMGLGGKG